MATASPSVITTAYKMGLKRQIVHALDPVFGPEFPIPDYRDIYVGLEYPMTNVQYPSILITYSETELRSVGVGYRATDYNETGNRYPYKVFRYQGMVHFNVMALNPLDRDKLSAALVNILAFAEVEDSLVGFVERLRDEKYASLALILDVITPEGEQEGDVPWGNEDEKIFTASYGVPVGGEFTSKPDGTGDLTEIDTIFVDPDDDL
jgi:hypothetical protein